MSLIIKGVDMPKTEYEEVIIRIKHTGEVCDANNMHLYAKAIEIPTPHGRLIDADEFIESNECCGWIEDMTFETFNKLTPTILEAEEVER